MVFELIYVHFLNMMKDGCHEDTRACHSIHITVNGIIVFKMATGGAITPPV